jgi:hypothetical protein
VLVNANLKSKTSDNADQILKDVWKICDDNNVNFLHTDVLDLNLNEYLQLLTIIRMNLYFHTSGQIRLRTMIRTLLTCIRNQWIYFCNEMRDEGLGYQRRQQET